MARVLVVDDDGELRDVLRESVELDGHTALVASNGREALRVLREQGADVVVLDLMMPVMNGWQFLEAVRAEPRLAQVPVIVISAAARPPPAPIQAYLPKPFEFDVLASEIRRQARAADLHPR